MFFLIGIVSFTVSFVLGGLLFLPLLVCPILFALAMNKFKKQSVDFALRAFALSFAASTLIFFTGFLTNRISGVGSLQVSGIVSRNSHKDIMTRMVYLSSSEISYTKQGIQKTSGHLYKTLCHISRWKMNIMNSE